jgi:HAE1 family hydrophobic/amphiphilic exporter-1
MMQEEELCTMSEYLWRHIRRTVTCVGLLCALCPLALSAETTGASSADATRVESVEMSPSQVPRVGAAGEPTGAPSVLGPSTGLPAPPRIVGPGAAAGPIPSIVPPGTLAPLPGGGTTLLPAVVDRNLLTTGTDAVIRAQTLNILSTETLSPAAILQLTSPTRTVIIKPVTLGDVIQMTLERNLDYRIARINTLIAEEEITAQRGIFDLVLSANAQVSDSKSQGSIFNSLATGQFGGLTGTRQLTALSQRIEEPVSDIRRQQTGTIGNPPTAEQIQALLDEITAIESSLSQGFASDFHDVVKMNSRTGSAQATQLNPWGGTLGLGYSLTRTQMSPSLLNINPSYSQALMGWVVQPLPFFRNFGRTVTLSNIRLAQKNREARTWEARQQLITQIATVTTAYWDLVFAIYNARVLALSLESGRNLLRINEIRLANEVGTQIDVWEARAGVAARENQLIVAVQTIGRALDNLARVTRVNESNRNWQVWLIPTDVPHYEDYPVDEEKSIAVALERRPDLQQARLSRERAEIREQVARNQKRPRLDAYGSYGITGLGPSVGSSGHYLHSLDYDNWSLGLDFSYPIPNRRARARHREAERLVEGSELVTEQVSDLAVFEVRNAVRNIHAARESIDAGQTRVRAEQEKLRGELKRYEVGMATSQDLLEYQDQLAAAQSSLIAAIVRYNQAIIDLERARATLLESYGIKIEVEANLPPAESPEEEPASASTSR